jgi:endonuclease I
MKKAIYLIFLISVLNISFINAQPTGYYNGTENKQGEELKAALNDIISGQTVYSYFYSKEIFKLSDADPDSSGNIIEIYTGRSWPNDDYGSGGNQLNREHVWAKSHGNFADVQPMYGDVHNLRPSDASVNTDKSNLDYDMGGTQHPEATGCYFTDHNWEPRDADKGDVARIILYMDTRYQGENGELDLIAVDEVDTYPYPKHGKLSTLLLWNLQDPPDAFERNRNNVIYSFQHNRNPFIDNPYFAELIWNNGALPTVYIAGVSQAPEIPVANQPVTISATINSTAGNVTGATITYGTSWGNLSQSVNMTGSGGNYSAQIPGQSQGTTVYYQITAQNSASSIQTVVYNFYVPKTFTGTLTSVYAIQGQVDISPFADQVVSTTGIVTANFGTGYFIQNGSGPWNGLYVYDTGRNPSIGDSVILTGTIQEYYTKTEIKSITDYYFISRDHPMPAPSVITCAQAGEPYEGVLIQVANATCTDEDYMANYYMWTVNDGSADLLVHNTAIYEYVPVNGEVYTVSGPLDYDFDEWKIQIRLGTDVQTGGVDVTPPSVSSVEAVTATVIKVQFSEDVDVTSAQTLSNYNINNGISVQQAAVHSIIKSQVFLTTSQLVGGSYELTVQNVADLVGNVMPVPVVLPFTTTYGVDEDLTGNHLSIYPNPSNGKINIEWINKMPENVTVSIYSMTGVREFSEQFIISSKKSLTIDAGKLINGLYMLEIKGDENVSRTKLMIR